MSMFEYTNVLLAHKKLCPFPESTLNSANKTMKLLDRTGMKPSSQIFSMEQCSS